MGLIELYILFAITTGIASIYELIWPVILSLKETNPELLVIKQWKLTVIVLFIMCVIAAPVLLIPCIFPKRGEEFRKTLHAQLKMAN